MTKSQREAVLVELRDMRQCIERRIAAICEPNPVLKITINGELVFLTREKFEVDEIADTLRALQEFYRATFDKALLQSQSCIETRDGNDE